MASNGYGSNHNSGNNGGEPFSSGESSISQSGGDSQISTSDSSFHNSTSLEGNMESASEMRNQSGSNGSQNLEGNIDTAFKTREISTSEIDSTKEICGNIDNAMAIRNGEVPQNVESPPLRETPQNTKESNKETPTTEETKDTLENTKESAEETPDSTEINVNNFLESQNIKKNENTENSDDSKSDENHIQKSDFQENMSMLQKNPELAENTVQNKNLENRIRRNNDNISQAQNENINYDKLEKANTDNKKAKGYLQEGMIRSSIKQYFEEIPDKTQKSVYEIDEKLKNNYDSIASESRRGKLQVGDEVTTFVDVEGHNAKEDFQIGDVLVQKGENVSIESKAGDEKYLTSQIEHIFNQLNGMDENSHKILAVTADYEKMRDEDKERLQKVLEDANANLVVLNYTAAELTDTISKMDFKNKEDLKDAEKSQQESSESKQESSESKQESPQKENDLLFGFHKKSQEKSESLEPQTPPEPTETFSQKIARETKESKEREEDEKRKKWENTPELKDIKEKFNSVRELQKSEKSLEQMNDEELEAIRDIAVYNSISKHMKNTNFENFEKIKENFQFTDKQEIMSKFKNVDEETAGRILGYYEETTENIKINKEGMANSPDEALVTITHETIHKMSKHTEINENGESVEVVGLKTSKGYHNVGMNEGVTQMYAIRDTEKLSPDYENSSYINEVEIIGYYESIVGETELNNAYFHDGVGALREDFDSHMGVGTFDKLCEKIDNIWYISHNGGDADEIEEIKQDVMETLDEYKEAKEAKERVRKR